MLKGYRKSLILPIIIVVLIIIIGATATYAYFQAYITTEDKSTTVIGNGSKLSLEFVDGLTNDLSIVESIIPGWSKTRDFSITGVNSTDQTLYYDIVLVVVKNEFSNDGVLKYSLVSKSAADGSVSSNGDIMKNTGSYSLFSDNLPHFGTTNGSTHNYTLTISFPNDELHEQYEQGKKFKGYLIIKSGKISGRNEINGTF